MADFPRSGCSWRLHVSHNIPIDDAYITPRMAGFASSVAYTAPPDEVRPELTGCKVFKHAFNMQYDSFEQKTAVCVSTSRSPLSRCLSFCTNIFCESFATEACLPAHES